MVSEQAPEAAAVTASNSSGFKRFPRLLVQGLGQVSPAPGHISQLAVPFAGSGPLPPRAGAALPASAAAAEQLTFLSSSKLQQIAMKGESIRSDCPKWSLIGMNYTPGLQ